MEDVLNIDNGIEQSIITYISSNVNDYENIKIVFFTLLIEHVLSLTKKNPTPYNTSPIQDEEIIKLIVQYKNLQRDVYSNNFKNYILKFFYKEISILKIKNKI
jgi:hypothetical protein